MRHVACAALLALLATAALAQYKVVAPDGSVTYTDRPPTTGNARVTALGRSGAPQPAASDAASGASGATAALPFDLRQTAQRYPVTLYTATDCAPCDAGRSFLQQRGVPFSERRVASDEDAQALERAVGARTVPALTVGTQALRGMSQPEWSAFLDAAGYPRESRLPRNYTAPMPAPMVERQAAAPRSAASGTGPGTAASPIVPPAPVSTAPNSDLPASAPDASGIRF